MMWFEVFNVDGDIIYEGTSWPMARAALDFVVGQNAGCPVLSIHPYIEEGE